MISTASYAFLTSSNCGLNGCDNVFCTFASVSSFVPLAFGLLWISCNADQYSIFMLRMPSYVANWSGARKHFELANKV